MALREEVKKYTLVRTAKIVPGEFEIVLRKQDTRSPWSEGDGVLPPAPMADRSQAVAGSVRFTCRAQNVRSESIDTGGRINDRAVLKYVISFVGVNHKYLDGNSDLYSKLPAEVPIILSAYVSHLTQFDGYDVEVSGAQYQQGGVFEADSIIVPKLGNLALIGGSGNPWPAALVMFLVFAFIFFAIVSSTT